MAAMDRRASRPRIKEIVVFWPPARPIDLFGLLANGTVYLYVCCMPWFDLGASVFTGPLAEPLTFCLQRHEGALASCWAAP